MLGIRDHGDHFDDITTYDDLYNAQWRCLNDRCGADTRLPPADDEGSAFPIPRTTNAEVRGLVQYWTSVVIAADTMPTQDWIRTVDDFERLTAGAAASDVYVQNNELWRALQRVATSERIVRAA